METTLAEVASEDNAKSQRKSRLGSGKSRYSSQNRTMSARFRGERGRKGAGVATWGKHGGDGRGEQMGVKHGPAQTVPYRTW